MILIILLIILILIYLYNLYNINISEYFDIPQDKDYLSLINKLSKKLYINLNTNNNHKINDTSTFKDTPLYTEINTSNVSNNTSKVEKIRNDDNYKKLLISFPKYYPISTNFDPVYNNYNNLLENNSISVLNNILEKTINKANENTHIIYFNPSLKQTKFLKIYEKNVIDFAKYIISIMNSITEKQHSFILKRVYPVSKEQIENQVRINFQIELIYNYPKSKNNSYDLVPENFPLLLNVILLFEKKYHDEEIFFSKEKIDDVSIYVQTLTLLGITNNGYLPGNKTKSHTTF